MRIGVVQQKLLEKLIKNGHITRLGWTYKQLSSNPKSVRDVQILSFVDYVMQNYKNVTFKCESSLDNSYIEIS